MEKTERTRDEKKRWDLLFFNQLLEQSYRNHLYGYQVLYLRFCLCCELIICLTIWIINPLKLDFTDPIRHSVNIVNVILVVGVLIYLHKKKDMYRYSQPTFVIMQLLICFSIIELARRNMSQWTSSTFTLTAMLMQVVFLMPFVARCHWKYNSISSLLMTIYLSLRFINFEENLEKRWFPVIIYIFNVAL